MKPKAVSKIYKAVSKELGVHEDNVKTVVNHFYTELREYLSDPKVPSILIHYLGSIEVNERALRKLIDKRTLGEQKKEQYEELIKTTKKFKNEFKKDNNSEEESTTKDSE